MTLEIYMKSGNVLVLDRVEEYSVESRGNEVSRLELKWEKYHHRKLVVSSIDLSSIEAVCRVNTWWERLPLPWRKTK